MRTEHFEACDPMNASGADLPCAILDRLEDL